MCLRILPNPCQFLSCSQSPAPEESLSVCKVSRCRGVMYKTYLHHLRYVQGLPEPAPLPLLSQSCVQDRVQVSKSPRMECQTNIVQFLAPNPTWRLHHSARVRTRSLQTKPVSWARCERKLLARSFKIPYFRVPPEDPPYPRRGTPGRFYFKVLLVTHSSPPTTASSRWWLWQEPVTKVSYLYSKVSYSCRLHSPT